ncbi:hypothetical protein FQN57_005950 [Myotisia sp. PD_48]|nr:hypothetical protein FQN57_005950 [Myotisia sp. PD_48]
MAPFCNLCECLKRFGRGTQEEEDEPRRGRTMTRRPATPGSGPSSGGTGGGISQDPPIPDIPHPPRASKLRTTTAKSAPEADTELSAIGPAIIEENPDDVIAPCQTRTEVLVAPVQDEAVTDPPLLSDSSSWKTSLHSKSPQESSPAASLSSATTPDGSDTAVATDRRKFPRHKMKSIEGWSLSVQGETASYSNDKIKAEDSENQFDAKAEYWGTWDDQSDKDTGEFGREARIEARKEKLERDRVKKAQAQTRRMRRAHSMRRSARARIMIDVGPAAV